MNENRKARGRGFYYLSRGQLAILAVAFTVTSAAVFFLGVFVGQGIEEGKLLKSGEAVARIPIQPVSPGLALSKGGSSEPEMTFYDTLSKTTSPVETKADGAAKKVETKKQTAKTEVKKTKASTGAKSPKSLAKVEKKARVPKIIKGSVWSVQVNAFRQQQDARQLARKLVRKGYDAYVISTKIKGNTWYRVRVGQLATRSEAKRLQQVLKTKEKYTHAHIARSK